MNWWEVIDRLSTLAPKKLTLCYQVVFVLEGMHFSCSAHTLFKKFWNWICVLLKFFKIEVSSKGPTMLSKAPWLSWLKRLSSKQEIVSSNLAGASFWQKKGKNLFFLTRHFIPFLRPLWMWPLSILLLLALPKVKVSQTDNDEQSTNSLTMGHCCSEFIRRL